MSSQDKTTKIRRKLSKLLVSVDKVTDMDRKSFGSMSDLIKLRMRLGKFNKIDEENQKRRGLI